MSDEDFITELFCRIDEALKDVCHSQASLYPCGSRWLMSGDTTSYRWPKKNWRKLFLTCRKDLCCLFVNHQHLTHRTLNESC
jgi:hypothetical protein